MRVGDLVTSYDWGGVGVVVEVREETAPETILVSVLEDSMTVITTTDDIEVISAD